MENLISAFMRNTRPEIKELLPHAMNARRYAALVAQYLHANNQLLNCDQETLRKAVLDAAVMGLEIGSPLNHATLMQFKARAGKPKVQLIIEYRGHITLCYRSGKVQALAARAVFSNDQFRFQYGSEKSLYHKPAEKDKGQLIAAYAIAYMIGDQFDFEVIDHDAAAQAMSDSAGADHPASIWKTRPASMWIKTAIRRLSNRLPQCGEDIAIGSLHQQTHNEINLQATDEYKSYINAMNTSPDLHSQATAILELTTPRTADECRLITNLMRHLFKQQQAQH
jgi:phage RecT family recombinase